MYGFIGDTEYKKGRAFSLASTMLREEGFKSFYRGYFAYSAAIVFWMSCLPVVTNFIMNQLPFFMTPQQQAAAISQQRANTQEMIDDDDDFDD